jgi:hypothetical protein
MHDEEERRCLKATLVKNVLGGERLQSLGGGSGQYRAARGDLLNVRKCLAARGELLNVRKCNCRGCQQRAPEENPVDLVIDVWS